LEPVLIVDYAPIYLVLGISHVTHLLTLITDYLSLKLPHEIIPPSRGNAYPSIRKSPNAKPIPISMPPDPNTENPAKAWQGKKLKDMPNVETLTEAFALVAADLAWVLWTQQLWMPSAGKGEADACRLGRNLLTLVTSQRIGRISHGSTMDFLPVLENAGKLGTFEVSVRGIQDVILAGLEEGGTVEVEGGGWDMVEGGEEVMRADGWLKLNPVSSTDG
jgi:Vacuolar sorting 38 and autophagy-related subunit 14